MKLDKITDVKILRNELKKYMIKCKVSFTQFNNLYKDCVFNAGEYYHIEQDDEGAYVYDDNDNIILLSPKEVRKYF